MGILFRAIVIALTGFVLIACASGPPSCDGSNKRPVNAQSNVPAPAATYDPMSGPR